MKNTSPWVIITATLFVLAAVVVIVVVWPRGEKEAQNDTTKMNVVTSFYVLEHFTKQVAEGHAEVSSITPGATDPHSFNPLPRDIQKIADADVFFYQGGGFDPWAERLHKELEVQGVQVINISESTKEAGQGREGSDPHIWLDPLLAIEMVGSIATTLEVQDPEKKSVYASNAAASQQRLQELHESFQKGLKNCQFGTIIVAHDAYGSLAARYNIQTRSIAGFSPSQEPSPKTFADIVQEVRDLGVKHVYTETLAVSQLATTVAEQAEVSVLVLNPLEGLSENEQQTGATYLTIMKNNLKALQTGLDCL